MTPQTETKLAIRKTVLKGEIIYGCVKVLTIQNELMYNELRVFSNYNTPTTGDGNFSRRASRYPCVGNLVRKILMAVHG